MGAVEGKQQLEVGKKEDSTAELGKM